MYLLKLGFTLWPLELFQKIKVALSQKRFGTTVLARPSVKNNVALTV